VTSSHFQCDPGVVGHESSLSHSESRYKKYPAAQIVRSVAASATDEALCLSYRASLCWLGAAIYPFHDKRHPQEMGKAEIERFLTHLAVERLVSASTQTQALCAVLFLYMQVLQIELPALDAVRAKQPKRLPVVLSQEELKQLLTAVASNRLQEGIGVRRSDVFTDRNPVSQRCRQIGGARLPAKGCVLAQGRTVIGQRPRPSTAQKIAASTSIERNLDEGPGRFR